MNTNKLTKAEAAVIALLLGIPAENLVHPENSDSHTHTDQIMPIQAWQTGVAEFSISGSTSEFRISGSTSCNYQDFV